MPYFNNWKHNILQRPGNFTAKQTHEGIQITCYYDVIEATKYLLKEGFQFCAHRTVLYINEYISILDINGVLAEETTIQQFFNLAIIILFVCKAQLLFLQEIQEVNTKTKEQPHGILLTTSFFHKEIVTYLQHIYTLGDKSSQKLIFNSIALEP